jgi:hypothetical protein
MNYVLNSRDSMGEFLTGDENFNIMELLPQLNNESFKGCELNNGSIYE